MSRLTRSRAAIANPRLNLKLVSKRLSSLTLCGFYLVERQNLKEKKKEFTR